MRRRRRTILLAIEGIDAAGKTTRGAALARRLRRAGFRVAVHRLYRHGLFHRTASDVFRLARDLRSRRLLRLERLVRVLDTAGVWLRAVEPDLERRDFVLLDRSLRTHEAAAVGRGLDPAAARSWFRSFRKPDATVLLDLPVEVALARLRARGGTRNPDEKGPILRRWRRWFLRCARREGWTVLDARAGRSANARSLATIARSLARRR